MVYCDKSDNQRFMTKLSWKLEVFLMDFWLLETVSWGDKSSISSMNAVIFFSETL